MHEYMGIKSMTVDGEEYDLAPIEPEHHSRPTPAGFLVVTPEVAKSWLRYNVRNRRVRNGGKRDYGSDMANGRYDVNGTTITFSRPLEAGEDDLVPGGSVMLVDGQHRLESCVDSNAPFVVLVVWGIKPEARRTVDTGIKRQLSDVFALEGEPNSIVLASVVKRAYFWGQDDRHLSMREESFTHVLAQEHLAAHPELKRSVEIAVRTQSSFELTTGMQLRQSVAGLAHWLFMQADETEAPEFFARLGDGANIAMDHPVSMLRRRLIKDKRDRKRESAERRKSSFTPDWEVLCWYIRTWNALLRGPNSEGVYPEFALVGRSDQKRMPVILTRGSVSTEEAERLTMLETAGR